MKNMKLHEEVNGLNSLKTPGSRGVLVIAVTLKTNFLKNQKVCCMILTAFFPST